jgi:DUF1365 family protein
VNSALYRGAVVHRRNGPVPHAFRARLSMLYLDLDELPRVFEGRWLWSIGRRNIASFRRADHLGDPDAPLSDCVRELVEQQTGMRPEGPIRLLTHLRYLGLSCNPVSLYYCFAADGEQLQAVVAEVHNIPWGERYCYALTASEGQNVHCQRAKAFHVSPFLGMDLDYRFSLGAPGDRLRVDIANLQRDRPVFAASLVLERQEICGRSLATHLLRHPCMTGEVVAGIYWQAFRLWWKGAPFHAHPVPAAEREEARA